MKIKIHRFLLAAALASGVSSSSLYPKTNAHDFPLRSVACFCAESTFDSNKTYCPIDDCEIEASAIEVDNARQEDCASDEESKSTCISAHSAGLGRAPDDSNELRPAVAECSPYIDECFDRSELLEPLCAATEMHVSKPDFGVPPAPSVCDNTASYIPDDHFRQTADDDFQPCQNPSDLIEPFAATAESSVSDAIQPSGANRSFSGNNPFSTGVSEEYAPYDFGPHEFGWLSRSGEAWSWKSAAQSRMKNFVMRENSATANDAAVEDMELPTGTPVQRMEGELCDPALSIANEEDAEGAQAEQLSDFSACPEYTCPSYSCPENSYPDSLTEESELCVPSDALDTSGVNLPEIIDASLNLLDDFACQWCSEAHDMHSLVAVGRRLGDWALAATHLPATTVGKGFQRIVATQPAPIIPPLMYVLYTTSDGVAVVVPTEMARAWNVDIGSAPEIDVDRLLASDELAAKYESQSESPTDETSQSASASESRTQDWEGVARRIGSKAWLQALIQIDRTGKRLQQLAAILSDWTQTQIAQGSSPSVR